MAVKSLSTLIKLQKTKVDEQRQIVARLQDRLALIEDAIAQMEIHKAREQAMPHDEAARSTYGAFIANMVAQGRFLERERQAAARAIKTAQDVLAQLFEEQKRYEVAEAQRLEAESKEERRREGIELDEIGGMAHERRRRDDGL